MTQIRILSFFLFLLLLGGCLSHPPYDVAFVVIYNKTPANISYSVYSGNSWSESAAIKTGDADYAMKYDIVASDEVPPQVFHKIRITTANCKILLDRKAIEGTFTRDPGGRKGWNLYVNAKLLTAYGCKTN